MHGTIDPQTNRFVARYIALLAFLPFVEHKTNFVNQMQQTTKQVANANESVEGVSGHTKVCKFAVRSAIYVMVKELLVLYASKAKAAHESILREYQTHTNTVSSRIFQLHFID